MADLSCFGMDLAVDDSSLMESFDLLRQVALGDSLLLARRLYYSSGQDNGPAIGTSTQADMCFAGRSGDTNRHIREVPAAHASTYPLKFMSVNAKVGDARLPTGRTPPSSPNWAAA